MVAHVCDGRGRLVATHVVCVCVCTAYAHKIHMNAGRKAGAKRMCGLCASFCGALQNQNAPVSSQLNFPICRRRRLLWVCVCHVFEYMCAVCALCNFVDVVMFASAVVDG